MAGCSLRVRPCAQPAAQARQVCAAGSRVRALARAPGPAMAFARPPREGARGLAISVYNTARLGNQAGLAGNAPSGAAVPCRPVSGPGWAGLVEEDDRDEAGRTSGGAAEAGQTSIGAGNVSHRVALAFARPPGDEARGLVISVYITARPEDTGGFGGLSAAAA